MSEAVNGGKLILFYVAARSEQGLALYHTLRKELPEERFEWHVLNCPELPDGTETLRQRQRLGELACYASDVTIFDASLDAPDFSQYDYVKKAMPALDHVLIVSRTEIPYNFEGILKGGSPLWAQSAAISRDGAKPRRRNSMSNEEIISWIRKTLADGGLELPRAEKWRMDGKPLTLKEELRGIQKQIEQAGNRRWKASKEDVFVSFRSVESRFSQPEARRGRPPMETLILDTLGGTGYRFRYFPPQIIDLGVITSARMMELVSVIVREMRLCGAVLVYDAEDYAYSWWTTAELLALSHSIFAAGGQSLQICHAVPVRADNGVWRLDFEWLDTPEQIQNFLPGMDELQNTRLARRYAICDPFGASPEFMRQRFQIYNASRPGKWVLATLTGTMLTISNRFGPYKGMFPGSDSLLENIRAARRSWDSRVYSREYWQARLIDCDVCREAFLRERSNKTWTVNAYLEVNRPYTQTIPLSRSLEIERFFADRRDEPEARYELTLPCGHHVRLRGGGRYFRVLYPRGGMKVSPDKPIVETLDIIQQDGVCW